MDLYSLLRFEAFLLVPVVCYFLFFKKNGGRSLYSGRDIFYPIKIFLAKRIVNAAKEKSRKKREKLINNNIEPPINFTGLQDSHYQNFSACDQKGNSLELKFTLKRNKRAEIILVLKTTNGSIYSFPDARGVHVASIKENKWKMKGLFIETLEPYRRLRIVFNGLLKDFTNTTYQKVEHVQFNFIFNCCSVPKFYPEDCDTSLLAEALATRPWRNASWKQFLNDHPNGYEQFGTLLGVVKGDSFPEEQVLNLPACRSRYGSSEELFPLDKEVKVFLAETNGVLIHLTLRALKEHSELNYGYIYHKNHITEPIIGQDIRLQHLLNDRAIPDIFTVRVRVKSGEYTSVLHLAKAFTTSHKSDGGSELFNAYAGCNVNNRQGKALLQFGYFESNGLENFEIPKPILAEKIVQTLPEDLAVGIKSPEARILEITGGKGNSLALLSSLGCEEFLVPDGFIITVNAFKRQMEKNKLLQEAVKTIEDAFCGRNDDKKEAVCAHAVRLFTLEPIHLDIARSITENLTHVKENSSGDAIDVVSWAVRSSAIGEDSEELSAAGQNETILGCVTEEEVLKAVSKCWASLFTYQSVQYRWQHGIPIKADMAVVVQKMVPAKTAGVLFTWHPTSSNPSQMVVTSNFGLGESVVSGKSDPDTFYLNRTYDGKVSLLHQTIGSKDIIFTLTEDGVKEIKAPENGTEHWSLTKEQVLKLGQVGVLLEEAFGGPRDIEWSYYKGDLYLLQSRPITTLNSWTDFELTHEFDSAVVTENSLNTVANTGEVFPLALSALCRSVVLPVLDRGLQKCMDEGEVQDYFLLSLGTFQYRVFLDCIMTMYINERFEEIQTATKVTDLAVFGHPVVNESINRTVRARLGPYPPFHMLKKSFRFWKNSRRTEEVVRLSTEFVKSMDFGINDDDDLGVIYQKIRNARELLFLPSYYHSYSSNSSVFWQTVCMMVLVGKQKDLSTELITDFATILSSCEDVESAEVPLYLKKIAEIIKNEGYSEEFSTIKPEFGVNWLQAKCPEAHAIFQEFLQKHGHRCLGEFELMEDTWGSNPSKVIPMLQANAKYVREVTKKHKTIDQVISDIATPLNFVTRSILKSTLASLRVCVGKREQSKSALILAIQKCRLAFQKLARAMVREGLMPFEQLVFHFTLYELEELIKKRNPLLVSKAIRRLKLYPKWNKLKFPELNYGIPQPEEEILTPAQLLPGTKCSGTPVCTGDVTARACVITHLDEIDSLEKDDILITYSTDIGWSPYFPLLSGVVTELGGLVSHGAVVAREYGLPCIVGVKNATKIFRTGDIVHLSGRTGELGKV